MLKLSKGAEISRQVDGKFKTIHIHPLSECVESIQEMVYRSEERIQELETELQNLRDEYDKDEEVAAIKAENVELQKRLNRGFPMSEDECVAVDNWCKRHKAEKHSGITNFGAIGGEFTYSFVPTSIGVVGTVTCKCGESFCFKDLK